MQVLKCESGARYAIIETIDPNASKLREKCSDISEDDMMDGEPALENILIDLYNTIGKARKINGLALPQIGIMKNGFVMKGCDKNGNYYGRLVINPIIVEAFGPKVYLQEECLSEPGVKKKIMRSYGLKVKYRNHNYKEVNDTLFGFEARVFQHEYDHLQGILLSEK